MTLLVMKHRKMEKKGEFYILSQPSRMVLSIVLVDSELPLSEEVHQRLLELQETSDIFFIFKEGIGRYSAATFGSLYSACGYIEAGSERLSEVLMRTFEYEKEIFEFSHSLILYTQTSCFTNIEREKLLKIVASSISKPVFQTRRLSSAEFFKIYKTEYTKKESWLGKYFIINVPEEGTENIYSSWTSESKEMLFRIPVIEKFIAFWKDPGVGYVYSFTNPDLRVFLASMCGKLKIGVLNIDSKDI